jgi:ComF family protein
MPSALVPVPLHPTRQREREFNQAEVLASLAGARLGVPVDDCLERTRYTLTQTHFHRDERFENLEGAFALRRGAEVTGRDLVLVDDVLTTGSTADACARVLREAGASSVVVITVARG